MWHASKRFAFSVGVRRGCREARRPRPPDGGQLRVSGPSPRPRASRAVRSRRTAGSLTVGLRHPEARAGRQVLARLDSGPHDGASRARAVEGEGSSARHRRACRHCHEGRVARRAIGHCCSAGRPSRAIDAPNSAGRQCFAQAEGRRISAPARSWDRRDAGRSAHVPRGSRLGRASSPARLSAAWFMNIENHDSIPRAGIASNCSES